MAINSAIQAPQRVGGVIGLSGGVFPSLQTLIDEDKAETFTEQKEALPFFLYHGKEDQVVDFGQAAKSYEKLRASGFKKVVFHGEEFLTHSVSPNEIRLITEFFKEQMP